MKKPGCAWIFEWLEGWTVAETTHCSYFPFSLYYRVITYFYFPFITYVTWPTRQIVYFSEVFEAKGLEGIYDQPMTYYARIELNLEKKFSWQTSSELF